MSGARNRPASVLPPKARRTDVVARIRRHDLGTTPEAMRAGFAALALGEAGPLDALPDGMAVAERSDGIEIRPWSGSGRRAPEAPVIWFHGGGYAFGSPQTHLRPAARLAAETGRPVFLPRYRLAPEHPWPAQLEDALTAVGGRSGAVLAGDSAGGHLALVTALELARRGTPARGLLLFSPNTDRTGLNGDRGAMDALDPMVSDAQDRALAAQCFREMPAAHRHVSPLLDDLSLLPPTHVEVGLPEVLNGDARLLHARGRAAGARITMQETPGLVHMGQIWAPWWDEARASLRRAAGALASMGMARAA